MAGVEADPEPGPASCGVDQRGQLGKGTPEGAAGAGGVLEMEGARLGLGQRLADDLAGPLDRPADITLLGRSGMKHHAVGPDPGPDPQGLDERRARFVADLLVGRGAVEQVDRVDEDRLDATARAQGLAAGGEVILVVGGRPPHPRGLVEDLDGLSAALIAASDGLIEAARR